MSYLYARYKKAHDTFVAQLNKRMHGPIRLNNLYTLDHEFIMWSHYSKTLRLFVRGTQSEDISTDDLHINSMTLTHLRALYIAGLEAERQANLTLKDFFEDVMDELPHGSGINYDWHVGEPVENRIEFYNKYENDDNVLDFTVIYEFDFDSRNAKFVDLTSDATEFILNDWETGEEYDDLTDTLDYLHQCFNENKEIKLNE